jgi:hypothetical protein
MKYDIGRPVATAAAVRALLTVRLAGIDRYLSAPQA